MMIVFALFLFAVVGQCSSFIEAPEELVNILGGTDSRYDLSTGGVLPFICRPWGFNAYAPMTDDDSNYKGWWFHPYDRRFFGIRVTHQPSPWIADYGNLLLRASIPATGVAASTSSQLNNDQYTGYSSKRSTFSPYYFSTQLYAYATEKETTSLEFSPSNHGGIMRVSFPSFSDKVDEGHQMRRISIVLNSVESDHTNIGYYGDVPVISGYTTANSGGVGEGAFAHYFVALVYSGVDGTIPAQYVPPTTFDGSSDSSDQPSTYGSYSSNNIAWMDFAAVNPDNQILTVRFATSFISEEQAFFNLEMEVGAKDSLVVI